MRLGATLVHLAGGPPYPVASWARRLVEAGFESLWTPEIIGRGPLVPDPFVVLAAAAVATGNTSAEHGVELGTATVQVPLHHPVELAHRVLSLQALVGPRLTLGVSPGSTAADHAALDRDFGARFAGFRRDLARVQTLVRAGGDADVVLAPAELAAGGPDLLLGSWGAGVERAAREFDGWLASGYRSTPDQILAAHDRYRVAGGQRAMVCAIPLDHPRDLDPTAAVLHRYADAGVDDAIVLIGPGGPDPVEVRALLPVHGV